MQKIVCKGGKCVDLNNLSCDVRFDDMADIIECEMLETAKNKTF